MLGTAADGETLRPQGPNKGNDQSAEEPNNQSLDTAAEAATLRPSDYANIPLNGPFKACCSAGERGSLRLTLAAEENFPRENSPTDGNFWTSHSRLFPGQVATRGGSFRVAIWQQGVQRREIK